MTKRLNRLFYDRDALEVARELLGKVLVHETRLGRVAGRIVEVEAYRAVADPANHGHRGQTRKNASMFGPPGRAYVYAIHARHCLNAVTEPRGVASAVLIRAVEPIDGLVIMKRLRKIDLVRDLARGPGRLCEAFGIDRALDGADLTRGERLWIADGEPPPERFVVSRRIGVSSGEDLLYRFLVPDSPFVSKPRMR